MRRAGLVALAAVVVSLASGACKRATEEAEHEAPVPVHCEATKAQDVDDTVPLRGRIQPPPGGDQASSDRGLAKRDTTARR